MAESRDDSQEKTEQATPRRLEQAREKGQVSRSRELSTMAILMGGSLIILTFGHAIIDNLLNIMRDGFILERANLFSHQAITIALAKATGDMLNGIAPLFIGLVLVALLAPLLVGGWIFSLQALSFKWDKLDPIAGIKRIFGLKSLMELIKAFAKFLVVTLLLVVLLWFFLDDFIRIGQNALGPALVSAAHYILWSFILLSSATILIALVDVPFQLWEHSRQLKMTKQELKDEMKETEGKPEVKSQIRALQRELANRRMMEEVPKADVIVTNPTHFAVALRYDSERMGAPRVIAKGVDLLAERIKLTGKQHGVTIFSAPLLARALYYTTKLDREIPEGLYIAVAQVLAYVFQLQASRTTSGMDKPKPPKDLPIPEEFQFER